MCTHSSICDEFLNVLYGKALIEFQTIHDKKDFKASRDSRINFATFIQKGPVCHFDQMKNLKFYYSDASIGDKDSAVDCSRVGQWLEAVQFWTGCGCRLRAFHLIINLSGTDDKYPDLKSWRTKLLGGTSTADALCAVDISDSIVIVLYDDWYINEGVEFITQMVKEVATRKRWDSWRSKERNDEGEEYQCWTWSLKPFEL